MPLTSILKQSYADTLSTLILKNRRQDSSFSLPSGDHTGPFLPRLEELSLENCNLSETISVTRATEGGSDLSRTNEPLLPLLATLFPSLKILDLSYNNLASTAFTEEVLSNLIFATDADEVPEGSLIRKGLRHFRLRGNKITDLDGFQAITRLFNKDTKDMRTWKLEELDLRDNEIGKLPPELGLLPLDVLLVDGNIFRVPPRRVWEREGTKGLLSWLRGRIE